jgi:hypothetical protein
MDAWTVRRGAAVLRFLCVAGRRTISRKKASGRRVAGSRQPGEQHVNEDNRGYAMQGRVGRKMRVQELATRWER